MISCIRKGMHLSIILFILNFFSACKSETDMHDATGTFESTEIIVSSEANGKIISFPAEEGTSLKSGDVVATIDPTNLTLQKEQVMATVDAIGQKQNDARPQIEVLQQQIAAADSDIKTLQTQLSVLVTEQKRISKLFKAEAATGQQMDEINGKVDVLNGQITSAQTRKSVLQSQIKAARDQVNIQNRGIGSERKPLEASAAILENQLSKTKVINPSDGTLLTKYINEGEFVNIGKPLYKLADLSVMTLRAYVTGSQLPEVKINERIKVFVDHGKDSYKEYEGVISWISDQAEFTPKTIQTKDERSNLVYAIKVAVKNDGYLKIGMYGEIELNKEKSKQ